jgi:hypothetical protein
MLNYIRTMRYRHMGEWGLELHYSSSIILLQTYIDRAIRLQPTISKKINQDQNDMLPD